jgi:peptide deformylase
MFDTILEFRKKYGVGRAIAAPQIVLQKIIICLNIDKPVALANPELSDLSEELFELWDDCMSFPNLLVKVRRHKSLTLTFYDLKREKQVWLLQDDLAELIQHEYDHLDGILATQRAIDDQSFRWKA